jgi:hypothetical protein
MKVRTKKPAGWTPTPRAVPSTMPTPARVPSPKVADAPRAYLAGFLAERAKPSGVRERKKTSAEVAEADAKRRAQTGEWEDAKPSTLVGLYSVCHRMVYGVAPIEFEDNAEFASATRAASALLTSQFGGDAVEFAAFVRWAWTREKNRAKWARDNGRDINRMVWRFVFARAKVGDYRVDLANRGRRA